MAEETTKITADKTGDMPDAAAAAASDAVVEAFENGPLPQSDLGVSQNLETST